MERRALLAVAISVLILVLYQELVLKHYYPPSESVPTSPTEVGSAEPAQPTPGRPELKALPPASSAEKKGRELAAVEGQDVLVETELYRAVFTTAGGRLKSFRLNKYRSSVNKDSPLLDLVEGSQQDELPFGVTLRGPDQDVTDAAVLYRVDQSQMRLEADARGAITFTGVLDGAKIEKKFVVQGNSYFLSLDLQVDEVPASFTEMGIRWPKHVQTGADKSKEVVFDSVTTLEAGKVQHLTFNELQGSKLLEHEIGWIAYSGKYFLDAIVPEQTDGTPGTIEGLRVWLERTDEVIGATILLPPGRFASQFALYLGPKELDLLSGHSLRRAVDLGWFSFIALPMLQILRMSHAATGNYGVDIILLTILIKVLFFPLTQKSFKSMKDMQKLQPEMAKIRERLKDKPDQMNKEIMELYRRNKVNPLGGCLPMLLQMPVFIGLYQALLNSVELRHAAFVGWINDLSAPDRLGTWAIPFVEPPGFPVLTLLMGASMVIQQWMTPTTTADPTQQRMMMLMPVVFTFMFINFPSGLTLYWLVNNILTIAQQYMINRPAKTR